MGVIPQRKKTLMNYSVTLRRLLLSCDGNGLDPNGDGDLCPWHPLAQSSLLLVWFFSLSTEIHHLVSWEATGHLALTQAIKDPLCQIPDKAATTKCSIL